MDENDNQDAMRRKIIGAVAALVFFGCATTKVDQSDYYDVKTIIQAMKDSETKYSFKVDSSITPIDLAIQGNQDVNFNPLVYKTKVGKNEYLVSIKPKKEATLMYIEDAEERFEAKDYEAAAKIYRQAAKNEPGYFKSYSFIGDCYYSQNRYDSAEVYFKKALALNPYDYQSNWFLSDTYAHTNRKDSAFRYLIKAWAINKNHKEINIKLIALAEAMDYKILPNRARFHFNIDRASAGSVDLTYLNVAAIEELGLSNCLACYEFEAAYKKHVKKNTFNKRMYLNCFGNHLQVLIANSKDGPAKFEINQRILDIHKDGLLRAYVLWEIGVNFDPYSIVLEDEEELAQIERYIRKYVLLKSAL